ncbi:cell division protein FtsQ/DivIB [Photobacterium atrarenae]|uniref:Cell division protein FtsQ n=1 Tax=Photobacterium atrarenae TaxID=865757 RepID=A0ABY5GFW6_9GAMM|nr:cell division protein FtsQ/DivIB [Photobacterium atrarenae]UTV28082.1 cell division protein FtsQ/DivIB [Photobacterium atrarenae]
MADAVVTSFSLPSSAKRIPWGGMTFFLAVIGFIAWLLSAGLTWMTDANRLPLSQLVIQGELTYLKADDVRRGILALEHLGSFMTQDVDEIQLALEALPWVARASVRKQWPDTIKVFLVEHQPAAVWNRQHLVNTNGEVFRAAAAQVRELGLVELSGPEGSSAEVLAAQREMQPKLQRAGLEMAQLALNERRSWRVWLTNGIRLELGREGRMERLMRFISLYPELEQQGKAITYVDLRYDTGAAVGWNQVPE